VRVDERIDVEVRGIAGFRIFEVRTVKRGLEGIEIPPQPRLLFGRDVFGLRINVKVRAAVRSVESALAMVAVMASPALALPLQCPLLIKQIEDATAGKTDADSTKAKAIAAEAKTLHAAGKHAEAIVKAEEAATVITLTLKKK
jgi:hypothetical protein